MLMKSLEEFIIDKTFLDAHRLNEMSTINRPSDNIPDNTKIQVYGEDSPTKTPHFHVSILDGKVEFEIEFKHIFELNIWRYKNPKYKTWDGFTKIKKRIIEWLTEIKNKNYGLTNLQRMIIAWNDNNPDNEIDDEYVK